MKRQKENLIITVLFCGVIALFFLLFWVLPKETSSLEERRVLAEAPQLSLGAVLDGSFEKESETYLADHFPCRKFFVGAYRYLQSYTGRNGESGVYRGEEGYLFQTPQREENRLRANAAAVKDFGEKSAVPVELMLVPSSGAVLESLLPQNHLSYGEEEQYREVKDILGDRVDCLPVGDGLHRSKDQEIYFKTDHHWTSYGAYLGYLTYCDAHGLTPLSEDAFAKKSFEDFYGTNYAKSGLWGTAPDTIELWLPPQEVTVEFTEDSQENSTTSPSLFFPEALQGMDPYNIYLNGNHSLVKITNDHVAEGTLLVVKDSYANALVPFLSQQYHTIYMVDLRYYRKQPVSALSEKIAPDSVLFLYSMAQFQEDTNFIWLK